MPKSSKRLLKNTLGRSPVHPFPARMAPSLALKIITAEKNPLRILDPMMGSGTVPAVARAMGHRSVGVDIDPLAVLITKVWTNTIDVDEIRGKSRTILKRAKKIWHSMPSGNAYPPYADAETRKFLRYWFDDYARCQLASLALAIRGCRNHSVRNVLWCGFSRLIIAKERGSSLARDLAHSRPHKSFETAPLKPFSGFTAAVEQVLANCLRNTHANRGPKPSIRLGDARALSLPAESIDLVLTSPPYLNAIDYLRCSKFSLIWMGCNATRVRDIRKRSVGSEAGLHNVHADHYAAKLLKRLKLHSRLSKRHRAMLFRFVEDMRLAIHEAWRVLIPGGKAIYIIGENTIRKTYIPNSKIITAIATDLGMKLKERSSRQLPQNRRYLPPPSNRKRRNRLDIRMRREVILSFIKPKKRA